MKASAAAGRAELLPSAGTTESHPDEHFNILISSFFPLINGCWRVKGLLKEKSVMKSICKSEGGHPPYIPTPPPPAPEGTTPWHLRTPSSLTAFELRLCKMSLPMV